MARSRTSGVRAKVVDRLRPDLVAMNEPPLNGVVLLLVVAQVGIKVGSGGRPHGARRLFGELPCQVRMGREK